MLTNLPLQEKLKAAALTSVLITALLAFAGLAMGSTIVKSVSGLALLLSIGVALFAIRSIDNTFGRLKYVSTAAEELANTRLPMLLEATDDSVNLERFSGGGGGGELDRIVAALNSVQDTTAGLAGKQHEEIREGLGDLVVNLVRRNQSLLDRQIEHIDQLEAGEEDPDRLESLFGIDHLATRMRRNAESLMVLAGAEPPRRKGDPISVNDLMRVAMSEIEGYQSIYLARVDDGVVGPQAAFDSAHLLAELLENATQFSPPNSQVEMAGSSQSDGSYLISIADHGIGMSEELIESTNELLRNPPELNLDLGRSLGFIVVARLAQRMRMTVELAQTPGGAGVTALVLIPAPLLEAGPELDRPGPAPTPTAPTHPRAPAATPVVEAKRPAPEPRPAAPSQTPSVGLPSLDAEPAWVPPALPERGSGGLGQREAGQPAAEPVQSDALARLLGKNPSGDRGPNIQPPTAPGQNDPATSAPGENSGLELPTRQVGASGAGTGRDAPSSSGAGPASRSDNGPQGVPAKLEEAIPTGQDFDAGVASLLDSSTGPTASPSPSPSATPAPTPRPTTSSGLVKRDRSRSQAPIGEGRVIGDQGRAATASSRDPAEIRNMLARYRKARGGTSPLSSDQPTAESTTESGDQS